VHVAGWIGQPRATGPARVLRVRRP
jgi:hypothetical protein